MTEKYRQKLSHLNDLFRMARCDNHADKIEIEFIKRISEMLGIAETDYEKVKNEGYGHVPARHDLYRLPQFHRIVLLACADKILSPEEEKLIHELGVALGMRPEAINNILVLIRVDPSHIVSPDEMLKIFLRYYN